MEFKSLTYSAAMYYSMQILLKHLLDTCYFLCQIMTEVTTWQNNDDNVIVQINGWARSFAGTGIVHEVSRKYSQIYPTFAFSKSLC